MSFGQFIALASFVLSMGTIAVTYAVGTAQGTAELCNPFIDGCTDITHTGMKGDAGFIFRGGMIAACAFFIVWWQVMRTWLSGHSNRLALTVMQFFGVLAALGLLAGTAVLLPEKSATHWGVHVRGANLFFQGMLIALTVNYVLVFRARRAGLAVPSFAVKSALILVLWLMTVAFAGVTVGIDMSHGKRIIEWWATLFIGIYFLTSYWDWKRIRLVHY
ncbi:MAG: Frag1/DRAM/Sfk1 family protein [Pseudomonadota bacterium]|nr:Frag1/DRAM/Sfk1 family protein [Pseudomonadota bacterium]